MRFPRFTIRSLIGVVLFVAIAFAALRAADDAWDSGVFGAALLILLAGVLLTVHRTEQRRAFWLGFALFGWVYFVASLLPPVESRLPTSKGLAFIDSKVPGRMKPNWSQVVFSNVSPIPYPIQDVSGSLLVNSSTSSKPNVGQVWRIALVAGAGGTTENFVRIGHSLLSLIMAFLGGCLSRWLHVSGRRQVVDSQENGSRVTTL